MKAPDKFSVVTEDQLSILAQHGVKEKHFRNAIPYIVPKDMIGKWKGCFGKLNVMFYIDRFGDFTSSPSMTARIVMAIYNSLDKSDRNEITAYLMNLEDDNASS